MANIFEPEWVERDQAQAHAEEAESRATKAEAELERLRALLRERGLSEE